MNLQIPFNDLSRIPTDLAEEISQTVSRISISGDYVLGNEVRAFEAELASYLQTDWSVGVASGTDALILALLALDVGPGDIVLTMANAGGYTTISAKAVGAEPVFVDVSEETWQMSLNDLSNTIKACQLANIKPKVLVITHLFGQLNSEISELVRFAHDHGLLVIEDCAQALGATLQGAKAGTFADLATFSFYPTKNLGGIGDGGALAGNSKEFKEKVLMLRQYGWSEKYSITIPNGRNSRLDEIQAAVLRIKLRQLDIWNSKRRELFKKYITAANNRVKFFGSATESYIAHLVPIVVSGLSQQATMQFFSDRKIDTGIHYPVPDHLQQIELRYQNLIPLPVTEKAAQEHITIPIFPWLFKTEIDRICQALREVGQ